MTLKFDGWPRKIIGYLFYTTSNFVHHFKSISEFKLELQSGNTQFRSKSAIFCPVWPWNLTYDLERQRAPFLCCFKHFASFRSHWWIQTGVTVRKHLVWVKFNDFLALVQVIAWCRQATSHYLSQCWPRSPSPYDVTRPQWVNHFWSNFT